MRSKFSRRSFLEFLGRPVQSSATASGMYSSVRPRCWTRLYHACISMWDWLHRLLLSVSYSCRGPVASGDGLVVLWSKAVVECLLHITIFGSWGSGAPRGKVVCEVWPLTVGVCVCAWLIIMCRVNYFSCWGKYNGFVVVNYFFVIQYAEAAAKYMWPIFH